MSSNNKLIIFFAGLALYFLSAGISYFVFGSVLSKNPAAVSVPLPKVSQDGQLNFDESLPKTEECPINGAKYSKQQEAWWNTHGPLTVMIENHQEARPQSGLSKADTIYEIVAEGGISRFLTVFYCQDPGQLGPIRSARTYFIDFASEYGDFPLYVHVGGANTPGPADALSQLTTYGWTNHNDLNQFSIGFPTFWRDYDRLGHPAATEHTMYSTTEKLLQFAATSRKLTAEDENGTTWTKGFVPYSFKEDAPVSQRPPKQTIHLEFWAEDPAYAVDWIYEPIANIYKRNNREVAQIDRNNSQQLTAKNIVVLYMFQTNANDGYQDNQHLLYKTKGVGRANIFMDGKQITGTWRKDSRTARTLLFDNTGLPIKFDRGTIWFEILPTDGILTVK